MKTLYWIIVVLELLVLQYLVLNEKDNSINSFCPSTFILGDYKVSHIDTHSLADSPYFVRLANQNDPIAYKYFRSSNTKNSCEFVMLNLFNLHDHYYVKGILDHNVIYLNGHLKETNQRKVIIGGTIEILTDSSLIVNLTSEEYKKDFIMTKNKSRNDSIIITNSAKMYYDFQGTLNYQFKMFKQ